LLALNIEILKKKLIFIELFYVFRNLLRNAKLQLEKKKLNARIQQKKHRDCESRRNVHGTSTKSISRDQPR